MESLPQTKYYPERGFKVDFLEFQEERNSYPAFLKFVAFQINSKCKSDFAQSSFFDKPQIIGSVRWDGCVNIESSMHFCDTKQIESYTELLKDIRKYAEETMPGFDG